ncbi:MAG: fibronectin type III domain-containing protein [Flavobacteriales bacterium]
MKKIINNSKKQSTNFYRLFLLFCVISISSIAQNVYVSPSGNNNNSGSETSPWQTIQYAIDHVNAGQTIYVRNGIYTEKVTFLGSTDSGSSTGGHVILKNYPNETPIIDGTGINPISREGLISIIDASFIKIIGFEIQNFNTSSNSSTPVGIYLEGNATNIELKNNTIHDIISTGSNGGAHGIGVFGTNATSAIHTLTIDNNEIYNCTLRWSEAMVLNGNVRNFTVSNNSVHDVDNIAYDFIGFEGECSGCGTVDQNNLDQARDGFVFNNVAYNIDTKDNPVYNNERSAAGFYVDGGKDIIFERNTSHHCNLGFELASEHNGKATSGIIVRNNFVYKNHVLGITTGGYSNNRGDADNCTIVNNTFYKNNNSTRNQDDWGAEILLQSNNHNNIYKNNIVFADPNRPRVIEGNNTNTGTVFDYNLYFGSTAGTAPGTNSIINDPLLVNPDSGDLHILNGSPAINTGENLSPSIIGDFDFDLEARIDSNIVDIGADENSSGSNPTIPNAPSNLTATSISSSQINLSWIDNSDNENSFNIERSLTGTDNWMLIQTITQNTVNFSDTGLAENTSYYYRINAQNNEGSSNWSNIANGTTQQQGNGTWTTLSNDTFESGWGIWNDGGEDSKRYAGGTYAHQGTYCLNIQDNTNTSVITTNNLNLSGNSEIKISFWYMAVDMENSNKDFWLQVSTDGGNSFTTIKTWVTGIDFENDIFYNETVNINNILFTSNTQIRFRCDASNNKDDIYIDEIKIEAFGNNPPSTKPLAPTNLVATSQSSSQIDIQWTDNSNNEDNFKLMKSLTGTGSWSLVANLPANSTSFSDTGLPENTTYFYKVRARNASGKSSWSNKDSATTQSGGGNTTIVVDGDPSDWIGITATATETNQQITSLKIFDDSTKLYFLLEGTDIKPHTQIFINSDNNNSTGYNAPDWTNSGADFMIEDNELYQSTANGSGWNWNYIGLTGIEYAKSTTVVEASILKSLISPQSTIKIGAMDLNNSWVIKSKIPASEILPSYTLSSNLLESSIDNHSLKIKAYPNPFNNTTTISYQINVSREATISIHNMMGIEMEKAIKVTNKSGTYIFNGEDIPNGIYLLSITALNKRETILLVKK